MTSVTVEALYLYPVKSLRGFAVESHELTAQGLKWDRHWMLIDENQKFVTQRQIAAMVKIHTRLEDDALVLSKEGMADCRVPLVYSGDDKAAISHVWGEECPVVYESEEAHQWLQEALGMAVFLVRMQPDKERQQSKPERYGEQTHTLFADGAPYLVCNQASLHSLNDYLAKRDNTPVVMENFRPNIVVSGLEAFAEHQVNTLSHNNYVLKNCYPCQRCIIPTINIASATPHPEKEPFVTLSFINPMPNKPDEPAFGENAILQSGGGLIRVGDRLEVG